MTHHPSPIRVARKQAGMTQVSLAKQLGVGHPTVGGWERGEFRPAPDKAVELTKLLPITLEEIYAGAGQGEAGRA